MRFRQFKPIFETLKTSVSSDKLTGLKDLISRRIKELPDDTLTAKALQEIEELLQHLGKGGRISAIGQEISGIEDDTVQDARKVLARLVLSIAEEVNASPKDREEFFTLWKKDQIVNVDKLLSGTSVNFSSAFNGYGKNQLMTEFINDVMSIQELGLGRGEFGLNVLSKSIGVAKASKSENDAGGSKGKKGDLSITYNEKTYQVELKTEGAGAARFGDQEVSPADGYEAAAIALNKFVKSHKMYPNLSRKLSGSGMNLNQAIQFHQIIPKQDQNKFLGLVSNCLNLIFGKVEGARKSHLLNLKKNVSEILNAIKVGDAGGAKQAYSQASFNYYMAKKHDDGVLYANLNAKTFVYYTEASQLLDQGLRLEASTAYISSTKDVSRSAYPQISVTTTTFGGEAAAQGLKKLSSKKSMADFTRFQQSVTDVVRVLAARRGIKNQRTVQSIVRATVELIKQNVASEQIIPALEKKFPELAPKLKKPQPVQPPAPAPAPKQPALKTSTPKIGAPAPNAAMQTPKPAPGITPGV
jgi:hypothetical protein